jgi:hypothetical protein
MDPPVKNSTGTLNEKSVLRTRDILVTDPDPSLFVSDLQDANKIFFLSKFLFLFLFEDTFTSFFKDKTVEIKVFLHFFAC